MALALRVLMSIFVLASITPSPVAKDPHMELFPLSNNDGDIDEDGDEEASLQISDLIKHLLQRMGNSGPKSRKRQHENIGGGAAGAFSMLTEGLIPSKALSGLQLSTPCGWFWHTEHPRSSNLVRTESGKPSKMSVVHYNEDTPFEDHQVFGKLPRFHPTVLENLTPHKWNLVPGLDGNPNAITIMSSVMPGHVIHHMVNHGGYDLVLSHQRDLNDLHDASFFVGPGLGPYSAPSLATFRTANIERSHHIVHKCANTGPRGELMCSLQLYPTPQEYLERTMLDDVAIPVDGSGSAGSEQEGWRPMTQRGEEETTAATTTTTNKKLSDSAATTPPVVARLSSNGGISVASERTRKLDGNGYFPGVPKIHDFENGAAFHVSDLFDL